MVEKMENNEIRNFVETFFRNLGASINADGEILNITQVPQDFESLVGKKSPYFVRFDKPDENSEYITKGSTLLKSMMNYLEQRGQTTLIKLNFEEDFKEELQKYFSFKNCLINAINKKQNFKAIVRFTITTTLQYLNEKEQITNHVCIEDSEVKDFVLENYNYLEGKKEELPQMDLKKDYEIAKNELKNLASKRIEDTAKNLSEKLEREIERVKNHYSRHKEEIMQNVRRLNENKRVLEIQLQKSKPEEIPQINLRIQKIQEALNQIEKSEFEKNLDKEMQFFIADEKNKHSLKINNKLINTSVIYYPIYNFEIFLKSNESVRKLDLVYDPMKDALLKNANCDSCKKEIREIFLCSSGHISCSSCREECSLCKSALCLACTKKRCDFCGRKLCKKCDVKCNSCWKTVCKNHADKNYADGKEYCTNCIKRCEICNQYTTKSRMRKANDKEVCEKCFRTTKLKD